MHRFLLLGPFELHTGDEMVAFSDFSTTKEVALLAYLLLERGEHTRSHIANLLWADYDQRRAKANLRNALYNLKKTAPGCLSITRQSLAFNQQLAVSTDIAELEHLVAHPEVAPVARVADLYRGELLLGLDLPNTPAFDEWLRAQRMRIEQLVTDGLAHLATYHEEQGNWSRCQRAAQLMLTVNPCAEAAHRHLMRCHAARGNIEHALGQYHRCQAALAERFELVPSTETQALFKRLKRQRDGHTSVPAFVGRRAERERLSTLLHRPGTRLVTLAGLGGVGKTTLARVIERDEQPHFPGGVTFVDLAAGGGALATSLAASLGVPDPLSGQPEALAEAIGPKAHLLIIDNLDEVTAGVTLLPALLKRLPRLTILVTARQPLNLSGETVVMLRGLSYGEDGDAAQRLFVREAERVSPGRGLGATHPAVIRICAAVGGLPLGIIMAARWLRTLPLEAIAAEVEASAALLHAAPRDWPARHHHIAHILQATWARLAPRQQRILMGLTSFGGPFTRQAFTAITPGTLADLRALIDGSLVQADPPEYRLHPLIRQFVAAKLEDSPLYAECVGGFVAYALEEWAAYYTHERDLPAFEDLLAAWYLAIEQGLIAALHQALPGLSLYCSSAGRPRAALQALEAALSLDEPRLRLRAYPQMAWFYQMLGEQARAAEALRCFERMARTADGVAPADRAYATFFSGTAALNRGDLEGAIARLQEATAISVPLGDDTLTTGIHLGLGLGHMLAGNMAAAQQAAATAHASCQHQAQEVLAAAYLALMSAYHHETAEALRYGLACLGTTAPLRRHAAAHLIGLAALALALSQRGDRAGAQALAAYVAAHPGTQVFVKPLVEPLVPQAVPVPNTALLRAEATVGKAVDFARARCRPTALFRMQAR